MKLEFSTTATCRPDVLDKTYKSFTSNLLGIEFRKSTLYLNVDPIPFENDPQEVIKVAQKHFGKVVANIPKTPNFCAAVKWCWFQPKGELFFHLEDDWIMLSQINIQQVINVIRNNNKKCLGVNLRAYSHIYDRRICLSPCLLRSNEAKHIAALFSVSHNPEKQLRPRCPKNPAGGKSLNCYNVHYPNVPIIRDIGRKWMNKNRNYKRGAGPNFVTWKKVK